MIEDNDEVEDAEGLEESTEGELIAVVVRNRWVKSGLVFVKS